MKSLISNKSVWFVTGSQHLYGRETLLKVEDNARAMAARLDQNQKTPVRIEFRAVLTNSEAIEALCLEANASKECAGLILWMHTFSPAQMWIRGLGVLNKPYLHLHTQFNRDIPWTDIDMDFMNLNQSAHGDREFGFISSRMKAGRAVVVGHWEDPGVVGELETWMRAALAWNMSRQLKVARFGDNMRDVAVTEGNKVSAHMTLGWSVSGYGVGELVRLVNEVSEGELAFLLDEYRDAYKLDSQFLDDPLRRDKVLEAARIEWGLTRFLEDGGFGAFTTTFEDLHGLKQLPGLAVQRLMEKGYGFGAEGDWKTAALVHLMKMMATGLPGGTSFMEDYTYHLHPDGMQVLGAHMLEVCPSIASNTPSLEVHPLSIGGKDDPARLVFSAREGKALNATLLDMGDRFRLLVNTVEAVPCPDLPNLPVARALWAPDPGLKVAAAAWILAGGAHHTGFTYALDPAHLAHFAEMAGIEFLLIGKDTRLHDFKNELRWNELYYKLAKF
jgi:L-arabinose isomerase